MKNINKVKLLLLAAFVSFTACDTVDFGSTNSAIAFRRGDSGQAEGYKFENRRISLFNPDGDEKDNLILSTNRAKSVVDWLLSKGVSMNRLTYRGYGEQQPIFENTNKSNKAKNRRTELTIK
mgnify:CR=1 FL=1